MSWRVRDFNPRAPRGARPDVQEVKATVTEFQSTRPAWGATAAIKFDSSTSIISIHAPRVGRDEMLIVKNTSILQFQSTRPVWGATRARLMELDAAIISIHAPRVGRDATRTMNAGRRSYFNPRAPCGARHFLYH